MGLQAAEWGVKEEEGSRKGLVSRTQQSGQQVP